MTLTMLRHVVSAACPSGESQQGVKCVKRQAAGGVYYSVVYLAALDEDAQAQHSARGCKDGFRIDRTRHLEASLGGLAGYCFVV